MPVAGCGGGAIRRHPVSARLLRRFGNRRALRIVPADPPVVPGQRGRHAVRQLSRRQAASRSDALGQHAQSVFQGLAFAPDHAQLRGKRWPRPSTGRVDAIRPQSGFAAWVIGIIGVVVAMRRLGAGSRAAAEANLAAKQQRRCRRRSAFRRWLGLRHPFLMARTRRCCAAAADGRRQDGRAIAEKNDPG